MANSEDDPSPLPTNADNALSAARSEAVGLIMESERLELQARHARRHARARLKHYERLVQEHLGQMSILDES